MTTRSLAFAACLALSIAYGAPTASAQTDADASELETEARARFSLGQLYYAQARFADAAREFEAAYALHPHPLLLHNLYLARRDMGDVPAAIDALTRYLASATDLSATDRRVLERRLAVMQQQSTSHTVEAPATHEPVPDPVVGDAPPADPDEQLGDPDGAPVHVDAAPTGEPPATSVPDEGLTIGAITSFSIAGAAVVSMLVTGPMALTERDHLASTCSPTCSDDQLSTARTLGTATDVAIAVGSVAAAAGVALIVLANVNAHADVQVTPSVSSDHAAVVVSGSF